jgi:hypothetical protein
MPEIEKHTPEQTAGNTHAAWQLIRTLIRLNVAEMITIASIVAIAAVLITSMSIRIASLVNTPPLESPAVETAVATVAVDKPGEESAGEGEPAEPAVEEAPEKPGEHTYIVVQMSPPEVGTGRE